MTHEEQMNEWVKGNSIHGAMHDDDQYNIGEDGECCPDFSCCHPRLLWEESKRIKFAKSTQEERERMMFGSISGLVSDVADKT